MSKHLIKIDNPQHCAISVAHAGKDNQYCEAGEVVAIDWQPSAGWGLQEAHYIDEDGNIVSIDLSLREFTMPAKAIVVSGTAKRFVLQDWTEGIGEEKSIVEKVAELTAKIEELESSKFVELFIGQSQSCSFIWPFETTLLTEIEFLGYIGNNMVDEYKILRSGLTVANYNASETSEYYDDEYGWWGDINSLEKGKWYTLYSPDIIIGFVSHVYIRPIQQ